MKIKFIVIWLVLRYVIDVFNNDECMVMIIEILKFDDKKNIILIFIKVNVNSKLVWGFVVMNLVGFVCVNYMVCCKVLFLFV